MKFYHKLVVINNNQHLKNLKASNVQDANEGCSLSFSLVQSLVYSHDKPAEHPFICGLGQGFHSKFCLLLSLGLLNIVSAHFDPGRKDCPGEVRHTHAHKVAYLLCSYNTKYYDDKNDDGCV